MRRRRNNKVRVMDYAKRYERWQNLPQMFFDKADARGDAAMFWVKRYDAWQPLSWREALDTVSAISRGLRRIGVERGDRVMLVSENRPECPRAA